MKKQQNTTKSKKPLLIIIGIMLLLVVAFAVYSLFLKSDSNSTTDQSADKPRNSVNYDPPTEEEQAAGDNQKDQIIDEQNNQTVPQTASVTISNASQSGDTIRVRAFVSNAIESTGTCTTTLTKGSSTVTKTTSGFSDASTTQCGAIDFTKSQFSTTGTWNILVKYQSPTITGSATSTIDIE